MPNVLIITGMHRSGTSMLASVLQRVGLSLGRELIAANSANPHGYFEDVAFYQFHEQLLHDRGMTYLYVDESFTFSATAQEIEHANRLIASRSHLPAWGWKDPRTSLFLDFWADRTPDARYLFVFRNPLDVVLSLLRRGEFDCHPYLTAGTRAWRLYNSLLLDFYRRNANRCALVHVEGAIGDAHQFESILRNKLELEVHVATSDFQALYHQGALRTGTLPNAAMDVLSYVEPEACRLYEEMRTLADLNSADVTETPPDSLELIELRRFASEASTPMTENVRFSLLQMLASLLEPERTAAMLERAIRGVQSDQQKVDYFWLELQRLDRFSTRQTRLGRKMHAHTQTHRALRQEIEAQLEATPSVWAGLTRLFHRRAS